MRSNLPPNQASSSGPTLSKERIASPTLPAHVYQAVFAALGEMEVYGDREGNGAAKFAHALNPNMPVETTFFLRRQANGEGGVYDPACGSATRIQAGPQFPNHFYYENVQTSSARIWQQVVLGDIAPDADKSHFAIMPILAPIQFGEVTSAVHSRFCGMSIWHTIGSFGYQPCYSAAWADKPAGCNVPPNMFVLHKAVEDRLAHGSPTTRELTGHLRNACTSPAQPTLAAISSLIADIDSLFCKGYLAALEDKQFAFLATLLLKAAYCEEVLRQERIAHGHLHAGNVTWELFDKSSGKLPENLNALPIENGNLWFEPSVYFADPARYLLIARIIDLGLLRRF